MAGDDDKRTAEGDGIILLLVAWAWGCVVWVAWAVLLVVFWVARLVRVGLFVALCGSWLRDDDGKRAAEGDGIILSLALWVVGVDDGKRAAEGDGIILSLLLWAVRSVVWWVSGLVVFGGLCVWWGRELAGSPAGFGWLCVW